MSWSPNLKQPINNHCCTTVLSIIKFSLVWPISCSPGVFILSGVHLHGDRCVCAAERVVRCVHGVEPRHVIPSAEDGQRWKSVRAVCGSAPGPEDRQLPVSTHLSVSNLSETRAGIMWHHFLSASVLSLVFVKNWKMLKFIYIHLIQPTDSSSRIRWYQIK